MGTLVILVGSRNSIPPWVSILYLLIMLLCLTAHFGSLLSLMVINSPQHRYLSLSLSPSTLPLIFILSTNSYLSLKYIHHQHSYLQSCYCNTKVERMRDTKLPEVVFLLLFTLILASKFTQGHRHVTLFYMNSSFHMSSIQFSPYFHLVSSTLSPFMILDLLIIY